VGCANPRTVVWEASTIPAFCSARPRHCPHSCPQPPQVIHHPGVVIHRRADVRDMASLAIWTHPIRLNNAHRPWVLTSQGDRGGLARAPYPRCRIRHQGTKRSPPAGSALPSRTVPNVLNDRSPTLLSIMTISLPLSFRTRPGILLRLLARSDPSSSLIIPSLSKNLAPPPPPASSTALSFRVVSRTLSPPSCARPPQRLPRHPRQPAEGIKVTPRSWRGRARAGRLPREGRGAYRKEMPRHGSE